MEPNFYLTDLLKRADLDPADVLLLRHPLSNERFRKCYDKGFLMEYTRSQRHEFSKNYHYWMVFIGNEGTAALFKGIYKVTGKQVIDLSFMPEGFPFPEDFMRKEISSYFDLEEVPGFEAFKDCLIIDWGKSTRRWFQRAVQPKQVLALRPGRQLLFPGYENVILSYDELKTIVEDGITYGEWHAALRNVYAIYLIVDKASGKQYVGPAYGKDGLLGRWSAYVKTKHGGNKKMVELVSQNPKEHVNFQFTILQILPKTLSDEEIIAIETRYKQKLRTQEFGLNAN